MKKASVLRIGSVRTWFWYRKVRLSTSIAIAASGFALAMVIIIGSVSYYILRFHIANAIRASLHFDAAMLAGHISGDLTTISTTLLTLSKNTVLTNALMDSMARHAYLDPFLRDFRQLNRIPIEITLTDYEGHAVAGSCGLLQSNEVWREKVLSQGQTKAGVIGKDDEQAIVIAVPIFYFRTASPEGALVYEVKVSDLVKNATQVEGSLESDSILYKNRMIHFSVTKRRHDTSGSSSEDDTNYIVEHFPITGDNSINELELGIKVGANRDLLERPLRKLVFVYGLFGTTVVLIVLILGRAAGKHLSKPLTDLERVVSNVVVSGSFNHRFEDEGPHEIARLGSTFNEMLRRLSKAHRDLERAAKFDELTGLANRKLFKGRAHTALIQADRNMSVVALLLLDLDNFKEVNDVFGHLAGDILLRQAADRLLGLVRETDTVARLGGDEFAIVATNVIDPQKIEVLAKKIVTSFEEPFSFEDNKLSAPSSIGIAFFPQDAIDVDELFRSADLALYYVKANGGNGFHFYNQALNEKFLFHRTLESSISQSLANQGLRLVYQPKFNIVSGAIIGCEALLRCTDRTAKGIKIKDVISVAEGSGLISKVGEWVLSEACRQVRDWENAGLPPIPISVNLSAAQLRQYDFVEHVTNILEKQSVSADFIEFEITESVVMEKAEQVTETLVKLHQLGLRLAIDDFGTGCSSMANLKKFPVDTLKIDASFVGGVHFGGDDAALTRAIVVLGKSLGLCVVAEGVENREQLAFLRAHGCDYAQGFFLAPPISGESFVDCWLNHKKCNSEIAFTSA